MKQGPRRFRRGNRPRRRQKAIDNRDPRAVRSRQALTDAFLKLLEAKPLQQVSIRDIVARAGVGYTTFFRHHAGKEALLDAIAAEQIASSVDLTLPIKDAGDDRGSLQALCHYVAAHWSLWAILLNGGAAATMREEWLRHARVVADTREAANSWLPKELGTICSTSLIVETIAWWLTQPEHAYSAEQVADILHRLIATSTVARG